MPPAGLLVVANIFLGNKMDLPGVMLKLAFLTQEKQSTRWRNKGTGCTSWLLKRTSLKTDSLMSNILIKKGAMLDQ